ncbi:hypothetical protein DFH07DRAFT_768119 [Mycena maculata]|uniref:Uncharacterized protein n=1 Tax=Mycena maculata TaxID=230809 RepID=A0AAD7JWC1_9AGAR|nr:hypothetical protein DFH07DRAFT_768119 [Mycena maculata]
MLSKVQMSGWKPHPATLIKQLALSGDRFTTVEEASTNALHNIHALNCFNDWKILGTPGKFPNFRELIVKSQGTNGNFNFVQIWGLKVQGLDLYFDLHNTDGEPNPIENGTQRAGINLAISPSDHTTPPTARAEGAKHHAVDPVASIKGSVVSPTQDVLKKHRIKEKK